MSDPIPTPYPARLDSSGRERGGYVTVEFKGNRRELFNNPYEFPFHSGDVAIVEAENGEDAGQVRHVYQNLLRPLSKPPPYAVLRRGGFAEAERIQYLRRFESHAIRICGERAKGRELQMKPVDAEYRFDGMKLTFYFVSEGRVDFRELVRDLATHFHTRIDLRQIGARDQARRSDGIGTCGHQLCCVRFLKGFRPITTNMARIQNLILNPGKLCGTCGRLKCCLAYEYQGYLSEPGAPAMESGAAADEMDDKLNQWEE